MALSTPPLARPLDSYNTPGFAEAIAQNRALYTQHHVHRHYTASADKPVNVNANQHSAALRSPPPPPPLDACYLARAIFRSEQHHAALGTAVSRARYPRGACVPLIPASQSQKQGAQASNSNNRPAVRMWACSCIKCLLLHYVTATTKTPTLCTMPVPQSPHSNLGYRGGVSGSTSFWPAPGVF